jgi:deoxyribose-phosphate aldolase
VLDLEDENENVFILNLSEKKKMVPEKLRENPMSIADYIDHTEVSPLSTEKDIRKLCSEANRYNMHLVMILPYYVRLARKLTKNKVGVVIGFPFGVQSTKAKIDEIKNAYRFADEFDIVMNRPAFKNKDYGYILKELKDIRKVIGKKTFKVIIESPELTDKEIKKASELVLASGADFVKTAVGLKGPAKVGHVKIMRKVAGDKMKVKASGGIKDFREAMKFISAGADRIGTSHGVEIIHGASGKKTGKRNVYFHE